MLAEIFSVVSAVGSRRNSHLYSFRTAAHRGSPLESLLRPHIPSLIANRPKHSLHLRPFGKLCPKVHLSVGSPFDTPNLGFSFRYPPLDATLAASTLRPSCRSVRRYNIHPRRLAWKLLFAPHRNMTKHAGGPPACSPGQTAEAERVRRVLAQASAAPCPGRRSAPPLHRPTLPPHAPEPAEPHSGPV